MNYTWAHTLDQGGVAFGSGAQDDTNYRAEYGNADYDVRHTTPEASGRTAIGRCNRIGDLGVWA